VNLIEEAELLRN